MNEPIADALVRLTEGGKALLTLPARGRALVKRVPEPVQLEIRKMSSRGAHVCREIFAGIFVVGLVIIVFGYGRLGRGPISLPSLVPVIETAINGELSDLHVKIDDAILQRDSEGPGVLFRLRNIRLIDSKGSIVAQSPFAAIGMSGSALLAGRVAPGSVDFIGPRLLLFYTADRGLSLSFSRSASAEGEPLIRGSLGEEDKTSSETLPAAAPETTIAKRLEHPVVPSGPQLDVARTITEVFERARSGDSSYLNRFGVKNATVVLDQDGAQTLWQVPDFSIDLEHKSQRSIILGQANIASSKGDWQLELKTEQRSKRQSFGVTALIRNLVPAGLADNFPSMEVLKAFDIPISGRTSVELSDSGTFVSGEAKLEVQPGHITPPWDHKSAMQIDKGDLHLRYLKDRDLLEIQPSTLRWGKSRATVEGTFRPVRDPSGAATSWTFSLNAKDSVLAAEQFGLAPIKVDEWTLEGNLGASGTDVTLSKFIIRSGEASIQLAGSVRDAPGSPEVHLSGTVSPMPLDTLKLFWPKFLAGQARAWVSENVKGGQVLGGKFAISLKPGEIAAAEHGGEVPPEAVNVEIDLDAMSISYISGLPPILTDKAKLAVAGKTFSVDIPQGKIVLPSQQEIALHDGRFYIADLGLDPQQGEITFNADSATTAALQLLDLEPLGYMREVGLKPEEFGGTAQGGFTIELPMKVDLQFNEIKFRGASRLENAIAPGILGDIDMDGGSLDINVNEQALEAKGDIVVKGVPATLSWQRVFHTADAQPPIKISATLDEKSRDKLGIKLNHLIRGPLPVTISILRNDAGGQAMSMQADLTDTQLIFSNVGWTKPKGHRAAIQFDIAKHADGATDLKDLKITGDDIAIDGIMSLDSEQHLKSFHFTDFSFDSLTHMEISAELREGNILAVEANGASYNGKQLFQSLFSAGQIAENAPPEPADAFGIDLSAKIGTVVGSYDTSAKDVHVTLKKRNGQLTALDVKGQLNGGLMGVKLDTSGGTRVIRAEARDAGAAFRLVGFYPSVDGGEAQLQVNLDAGDQGTKSGTLWARDFVVLGDSVVSDVLADPNATAALGQQRKQQAGSRARIAFNQLRAPFSVGSNKFYLKDAYMNGPALGATMRGSVDFKTQTVDLGGTYVPLYGLNSAFRAIPILGPVLGGRKGEGLVGITFAIQGKLSDPAVLVNPMSALTPGIFRQIFEFGSASSDTTSATSAQPPPFGTTTP